jgi:protease IV
MSKRRRRTDLVIAVIFLGSIIGLVLIVAGSWNPFDNVEDGVSFSGNRVGLIDILGPIYDARQWVNEIDDFRENDRIKAIVIRLDSPGGAVAASQELYEAVKRAAAEKPVVASMGNVAASGAYYTALGADSIVANPGTTTGSIGVIMEILLMEELFEKLGLDAEVVKSGVFKDAGNPTRQMTTPERQYFQSYIDDAYAEFVNVVEQERTLDREKVLEVADGRVFTGTQALEHGLVDILGDQYLAIHLAAQMAGIEEEPTVVRPYRRSEVDWLDLILGKVIGRGNTSVHGQGLFQYLWKAEFNR